jgi:peptidoglycan/LPS O-acetylase OafA/YrhL
MSLSQVSANYRRFSISQTGSGDRQTPVSSFRSDSGNLDLIRAAAVLSVLFQHVCDYNRLAPPMIRWHVGQLGVITFFVHTSMVLMLSLERAKLQGTALFGSFYLRRFFRLYPLSVFCVTVAMITGQAPVYEAPFRHWRFAEYLSNVMLTNNLTITDSMVGGLWSLPIEVQMYICLPFLFLLGRARPAGAVALLWVLSVPLAILQLHISCRLSVLGFAPCFIAGVIAWKLSLSVKRRLPGWLWPFAFAATAPIFFLAAHKTDMYYRWIFCLALGLAIPWFQEVRFRPLQVAAHAVAKYSYGIYLSHLAVIMWSFGLPVPVVARWVICGILTVAAPIAMFHCIEHPMIAAGQNVARRFFRASGVAGAGAVHARAATG